MYEDIRMKSIVKNYFIKNNSYFLELFDSPFYPDGIGGQLGDRGTISQSVVLEVCQDSGGNIIHRIDRGEFFSGETVDVTINSKRRFDISQQHTAQHIISANAYNFYGYNTVGFQMGEEYSTVDFDTESFDWDKSAEIEIAILEQAYSKVKIEILNIPYSELYKYPLRKKPSDKLKGKDELRIVKIGELDFSLCGGFHVDRLFKVLPVKIVKYERIKGGWTRVYFLSGIRAMKDYQRKDSLLHETTNFLSTSQEELNLRLKNLIDENKVNLKLNKKLSESLANEMYNKLRTRKDESSYRKIIEILPTEYSAKDLSGKIMKEKNTVAVMLFERSGAYGLNIVSTYDNINAKEILSRLSEELTVKGGGNEKNVLGTVHGDLSEIKAKIEKIIDNMES